MGSRAEIVVIDAGTQRKFYTHWGARSLHLDLLPGAQSALRFVAAQEEVQNWIYDLEAAAVIDVDRRMLLWYSSVCEERPIRSAVFETMRETWPDWCLHWAEFREVDLSDYCAGRWPQCIVTVVGADKSRVYTPAIDLTQLLEQGPVLVDVITGWEEANRLSTMPAYGLRLDPARKSGAWWSLGDNSGVLEAITGQWRGWSWENWDDRLAKATAAADPGPHPELMNAFRALSESFERHQLIDAGTEASAALLNATNWLHDLARTAGQTVTTIEDNAFTHRPIELSPTELNDTRQAIAAATIRSQP
ncbi:hypothetical protein ACFWF7_19320 [Nocardia sp. NPDC060256]|uniref:hypothetical protein n=1 Tax=unclassified Nocardia TaxID=2637762 RepID=UPI003668D917